MHVKLFRTKPSILEALRISIITVLAVDALMEDMSPLWPHVAVFLNRLEILIFI